MKAALFSKYLLISKTRIEPVENFEKFFTKNDNKILDVRNVWLLNYRNMGHSDHHESFDMNVRIIFRILNF